MSKRWLNLRIFTKSKPGKIYIVSENRILLTLKNLTFFFSEFLSQIFEINQTKNDKKRAIY